MNGVSVYNVYITVGTNSIGDCCIIRYTYTNTLLCLCLCLLRVSTCSISVFLQQQLKQQTYNTKTTYPTQMAMAAPASPQTFLTETQDQAFDAPFEDLFAEDVGELEALVAGVTSTTQSTLLLKKRKEMREVDDALDFMKEEFGKRMDAVSERQIEFEKRKKEMKESVTKFEKFIKENEAKRKRAETKLKTEQKAREGYMEKEKEQRRTLKEFVDDSKILEVRLHSLLRYQSYLESVIAPGSNDNDFEDIGEVLSRYQTLLTANKDLQNHQTRGEADFDSERNKNARDLEEAQNSILVNNSDIHERQKANETLKKETSDLSAKIDSIQSLKRSTKTEHGQVVMSIKNLHNRCADSLPKGKNAPPFENDEKGAELEYLTEGLEYVASRVNDLRAISEGYAKYKRKKSEELAEKQALLAEEEANMAL